jgi:hypothetical protein
MTEANEKLLVEAAIIDRHIRDFIGFGMVVACDTCSDQRCTTVKALAERWGNNLTFRQLIAQMACPGCGNKPSAATITRNVARWDVLKPSDKQTGDLRTQDRTHAPKCPPNG